jgi:hypothetical protein
MKDAILKCKSCGSSWLTELDAELCVHFPGIQGLNVEPIWAFPKLTACLACGFVEYQLSAEQLGLVRGGLAMIDGTLDPA